jgi:hypothetical protein
VYINAVLCSTHAACCVLRSCVAQKARVLQAGSMLAGGGTSRV